MKEVTPEEKKLTTISKAKEKFKLSQTSELSLNFDEITKPIPKYSKLKYTHIRVLGFNNSDSFDIRIH